MASILYRPQCVNRYFTGTWVIRGSESTLKNTYMNMVNVSNESTKYDDITKKVCMMGIRHNVTIVICKSSNLIVNVDLIKCSLYQKMPTLNFYFPTVNLQLRDLSKYFLAQNVLLWKVVSEGKLFGSVIKRGNDCFKLGVRITNTK